MYKFFLYISLFFCCTAGYSQTTDTFSLFFDLGVPTLNQKMQKKIDLLIYNDKIIHGSKATIVGYCDYLGGKELNQELSMKRAENVKKYLVDNGFNEQDITLCVGKGKVEREGLTGAAGYPTDRRVDIVMNNGGQVKKGGKPGRKDSARLVNITNVKDISKAKVGTIFQLNNVYFPADRHVMKPESLETLEKLYTMLKDNPQIHISIEGHICCVRDAPDAMDIDTYEPQLSLNRAKAIYKFLVDKGIDPRRLHYVGYGRRFPVVANEQTEEDADKNRRVEIRITQNN